MVNQEDPGGEVSAPAVIRGTIEDEIIRPDPVTLQLVRGLLRAAREECEVLIERTAMSPFIREKKDFRVCFLDSQGRSVYGEETGADTLPAVWRHYPVDDIRPNDVYWYNDAYASGGAITHTPDMVFIVPVFYDNELVAYSYSWAHFWDLGGLKPGSIGPSNTEIFHDGTLVPPIRIVREGQINDEAYRIILRNSRYPDLLRGDIEALLAAARMAQARLEELFGRFGTAMVQDAFNYFVHETATFVRQKALETIPEGEYVVSDYMDSDGIGDQWYAFRLKLIRRDDQIMLDATDSDDQCPGSINFLASDSVLKFYFGQHFHGLDSSLLLNQGVTACVDEVRLREGSILQPRWPAALGSRAHTFGKLRSAVRAVVARATQGNVMAASAVYAIAYWRMKDPDSQEWSLCTDGIAVGHGARPHADGLDAIYLRNNQNYPAEFIDMEFPLRVEQYALHPDSGGPGLYRGGCGVIRDVRLLAPEGTFGLRVEHNRFPTWGVAGGMGGGTARVMLNPGTPTERDVRPFSDDNRWHYGDLVRIYTAGGGGWGDPLERDPTRVQDDVRGGFVSVEGAERDYGVVLTEPSLEVDTSGTNALRRDARKEREGIGLFHRFQYFDEDSEERAWVEHTFPRSG